MQGCKALCATDADRLPAAVPMMISEHDNGTINSMSRASEHSAEITDACMALCRR